MVFVKEDDDASSSSYTINSLPTENSTLLPKPHQLSSQSKTFANVFMAIVGAKPSSDSPFPHNRHHLLQPRLHHHPPLQPPLPLLRLFHSTAAAQQSTPTSIFIIGLPLLFRRLQTPQPQPTQSRLTHHLFSPVHSPSPSFIPPQPPSPSPASFHLCSPTPPSSFSATFSSFHLTLAGHSKTQHIYKLVEFHEKNEEEESRDRDLQRIWVKIQNEQTEK